MAENHQTGITKQQSKKMCEYTSINLIVASRFGCTTDSMLSVK
ncbi:hypothetical protein T08_5928 [Trichinella sp. T8]|nr:hypothetical protein T08_5928 [Trichinella sp. T8]